MTVCLPFALYAVDSKAPVSSNSETAACDTAQVKDLDYKVYYVKDIRAWMVKFKNNTGRQCNVTYELWSKSSGKWISWASVVLPYKSDIQSAGDCDHIRNVVKHWK